METHDVPVEERDVPCTFGHGGLAVARFSMPEGCAAMPDVREQDLCLQHIVKAEPIGKMEMTLVFRPDALEFLNSNYRRPEP